MTHAEKTKAGIARMRHEARELWRAKNRAASERQHDSFRRLEAARTAILADESLTLAQLADLGHTREIVVKARKELVKEGRIDKVLPGRKSGVAPVPVPVLPPPPPRSLGEPPEDPVERAAWERWRYGRLASREIRQIELRLRIGGRGA